MLQPSVIWIGDTEKMFYKKVPKEEKEVEYVSAQIKAEQHCHHLESHSSVFACAQLDPNRLKKDLPKSLKLIKGEDRVLIVGTTRDPSSADIKSLCKMYSKIILIPRPEYGSRFSKNRKVCLVTSVLVVGCD